MSLTKSARSHRKEHNHTYWEGCKVVALKGSSCNAGKSYKYSYLRCKVVVLGMLSRRIGWFASLLSGVLVGYFVVVLLEILCRAAVVSRRIAGVIRRTVGVSRRTARVSCTAGASRHTAGVSRRTAGASRRPEGRLQL